MIFGVFFLGAMYRIPEVGQVSTRFLHIYFFPILPIGTVFTFTPAPGEEAVHIKIAFNFKSMCVGYLRAWTLLITFLMVVLAFTVGLGTELVSWLIAGVSATLFGLSHLPWVKNATYEQAMKLGREQLQFTEEGMRRLDAIYAEKSPYDRINSEYDFDKLDEDEEGYSPRWQ